MNRAKVNARSRSVRPTNRSSASRVYASFVISVARRMSSSSSSALTARSRSI